jgi:hypothetical protein
MSYGLEIRDTSGNVTFNSADRISRYVATYTGVVYYQAPLMVGLVYHIGGGTWALTGQSWFIPVTGMTTDGTWGVIAHGFPQLTTLNDFRAVVESSGVRIYATAFESGDAGSPYNFPAHAYITYAIYVYRF